VKLNPKQQRFVEEYPVDLNATQAAIRAGYSAATAKQQGSRLLTHVDVAAAIRKRLDKRSEKAELTQEWVLAQLRVVQARAVEIDQLSAANRSLELLGKHQGMFTDRVEVGGQGGGPLEVAVTRKVVPAVTNRIKAHLNGNGNGNGRHP